MSLWDISPEGSVLSLGTEEPPARRQRTEAPAQQGEAAGRADGHDPESGAGKGESQLKLADVHALVDPSLVALRAELAGDSAVPTVTVPVASPFPSDTRAQPYAANLLDLQIAGVGATPETWCLVGRLELAPVSGYYARLATQEQPGHSIVVPVGHAGVALLLDALYSKRAQLDAVSCVDLLQAAAFLQVECCLRAAGQYLMDHVFSRHAAAVLRVARSLGLKALRQQINTHIAANFFMFAPPTLAALLREMGTEEAEALLGRQDLCCPLEFFLVEVLLRAELLSLPPEAPEFDAMRLLNCVRWGSLSAAELRAVALFARRLPFAKPGALRPEVSAALAWRLVDAGAQHTPVDVAAGTPGTARAAAAAAAAAAAGAAGGPAGPASSTAAQAQQRDAAGRTLQLPVLLGSCGELPPLVPPLRSEARQVSCAGASWVYLEVSSMMRGSELWPELSLGAVEGSFDPGLVLCFLSVEAAGMRIGLLQPTSQAGARWHRTGFLSLSPLQSGDGRERLLLLGCYVPPPPCAQPEVVTTGSLSSSATPI